MSSTKPTENSAESGNKSKPLLAVVAVIQGTKFKTMSYDETRISDQIDAGLNQQKESIKIDYAIYGKVIDKNPLIRYGTLQEAKEDYLQNEYAMIVCEVSELRNGKRIITQERVLKAPQIWLPADRFIPEFDGMYLCHIVRKEECGNFKKYQSVLSFEKVKWKTVLAERVTHWMIVENPISKIKLL